MPKKLFVFYIGGRVRGANIEVHDARFAVGATAEDCHDTIRRQWWGRPETLHLDCWGALESADGHTVALKPEPFLGSEKLWFVNLGGYDRAQFTELHRNVFVVASGYQEAKTRALAQVKHWAQPHRDDQYDVDDLISLGPLLRPEGLHVHLMKAENLKPFTFTCRYLAIGKES